MLFNIRWRKDCIPKSICPKSMQSDSDETCFRFAVSALRAVNRSFSFLKKYTTIGNLWYQLYIAHSFYT